MNRRSSDIPRFASFAVAILVAASAVHNRANADSTNVWVCIDSNCPGTTGNFGLSYDAARNRIVSFGGDTTWEWNGDSWYLMSTGGPVGWDPGCLVYDTASHNSLLYGGYRPDYYFDETWTWDGDTWVQRAGGPGNRAGFGHSYDTHRQRVVLYGGENYQTFYDQTWEWDGSEWQRRDVTGPSARGQVGQMAFDTTHGTCVLFGGVPSWYGSVLRETWLYDGDTWVLADTAGPPARDMVKMAYDKIRDRVVLFGGSDGVWDPNTFHDTWEWDGEEWTEVSSGGPGSPGQGPLVWDDSLGRVVMLAGPDSLHSRGQLWIYPGFDDNVQVWVPDSMTGIVGDTVLVPILISGQEDDSVFSADITLRFGESVLTATGGFDSGDVAHGWSIDANPFSDSLVIGMAGVDPLGAGDTLLIVKMLVDTVDTTIVWFERCLLNEGNVSCTTHAGIFYGAPRTKSISGTVEYYGGTEEGILDVLLVLSGDVTDTTYTDSSGNYAFTVIAGYDVTVSPGRSSESREPAVSAYDAALVLQHAVHKDTLDSLQFIAGDVNGSGILSAFDASFILRYVVGIVSHFQVGDWTFRPPQRVYEPLSENQVDQDYAGILYGDPSGNWSGLDALAAWEGVAAVASRSCFALNLPESECSNALSPAVTETSSPSSAQAIVFPIVAHDVRGLISADAVVRYDAEWYVLRGIRTTAQTEGYMVAANDRGGYVRIAMAGTKKLNGDVRLLELVFEPAAQASAQSSVSSPIAEVVWLMPNEGAAEPTEPAGEGAASAERRSPAAFYLGLPKPNPFGDGTCISYGLLFASDVDLSLFDVTGKKVRTMAAGTHPAGRYSLTWDGLDAKGQLLANGLYFVRMKTPTSQFEGKVTLLR